MKTIFANEMKKQIFVVSTKRTRLKKKRWENAVLLKNCASGSVKKALSLVLSDDVCFCQEATEPTQWKTATFRPSQSMEYPIAISLCP